MAGERLFADEELEALRRKYFPRIPWTGEGPVRRRYRVRPTGAGTAEQALAALAETEGFAGPEGVLMGDAARCEAAFRARGPAGEGMLFGLGTDVCWCDLALSPPDGDGWQDLLVRSETAENLIALAHAVGALRFRKGKV